MKNNEDLIEKIAHLESVNDLLLKELGDVDHLMRLVGFPGGLTTVKATAKELYRTDNEENLECS